MIVSKQNLSWERRLYDLAQAGSCSSGHAAGNARPTPTWDNGFQAAARACEAITAEHSRSFFLASGLLPADKRRAMRVLYAFCRTADNLADCGVEQPAARLRELRQSIAGQSAAARDPVITAWTAVKDRYAIPLCYAEQLLDGVERDLVQRRYQTFEDLSVYCYGVASTVGLMSMRITGYSGSQAVPYAIKLGVALQLTNILRDIGEDWQSGRLYLPLEELADFGLDERAVAQARVDTRWRALMSFQIARARRLYAEALPGIALLHPDGRFAVAAAALLYRGILDDIEAHHYDVFTRRAFVSQPKKLVLLARAFVLARSDNKTSQINDYPITNTE